MQTIKAYVHLAYGFDAQKWNQDWKDGKKIGLNEEFPYGYHHAAVFGARVIYSTDRRENAPQKLLRYALRLLCGFDLVHAWRNRQKIHAADIVWTHTESQSLAVLCVMRLFKAATKPKIIAQSVWLYDEWPRLNPVKKLIYRRLLRSADILSVLSPLNQERASQLFPQQRVELVKFGIKADFEPLPKSPLTGRAVRVLSLGNDRHRDWDTLIDATRNQPGTEVKLATASLTRLNNASNITIVHAQTHDELLALFDWADLVVVTLKPNLHASGITVIEEAVVLGVPVICTRVGGLEAYFRGDEVFYVEGGDPAQLRRAIQLLTRDEAGRQALRAKARQRLYADDLTSTGYARRHVELSKQLLGLAPPEAERPKTRQINAF
ncbi:MAG TPA: glycosyltransferase [Acidocella sp.]|nr:glycosyltransferase [Acidocella sp.]